MTSAQTFILALLIVFSTGALAQTDPPENLCPDHLDTLEFQNTLRSRRMTLEGFHTMVDQSVKFQLGELPEDALGFDPFNLFSTLTGITPEASLFRNAFTEEQDRLFAARFPTPLQPLYDDITLVVHQEKPLAKETVMLIKKREEQGAQTVLLLDTESPVTEPEMLSGAPLAFYSLGGIHSGIRARKATIVGGYLDACVAAATRDLILHSLEHPEIRQIQITYLPSLIYAGNGTDGVKIPIADSLWDAAQETPTEKMRALLLNAMDLLYENPTYDLKKHGFRKRRTIWPRRGEPFGFLFRFEKQGKTVTIRIPMEE